jgi:hypothetical protein
MKITSLNIGEVYNILMEQTDRGGTGGDKEQKIKEGTVRDLIERLVVFPGHEEVKPKTLDLSPDEQSGPSGTHFLDLRSNVVKVWFKPIDGSEEFEGVAIGFDENDNSLNVLVPLMDPEGEVQFRKHVLDGEQNIRFALKKLQ